MTTATIPAKAQRAFLGLSHSPLIGLNPVAADIQAELDATLAEVRRLVLDFAPARIVLVGPDHYNGFFNELMPPFCLGTQATAVGDYLTPAGTLNVPEDEALALAHALMEADFDIALSRRMKVDHGFSQALQTVWGDDLSATPPVIPVFLNAVAQPGIARLRRCAQLGQAIGRHLDTLPGRTLVIGSGGLSHEPPVPTLAHPDPAVREAITARQDWTPAQREAKTARVMQAGMDLAACRPTIKPLNPDWDRAWMDALASGELNRLTALSEDSVEQLAGLSAHESKTWLVARAALPTGVALPCALRYYRAIPEFIAGYGALLLTDA